MRPRSYGSASFEAVVKMYTTTNGRGVPRTSRTDDNIVAVHAALQHDRWSTVCLLEELVHINREMIRQIITKDLGKKNLRLLHAACVNSGAKSRLCGLVRRPSRGASP